MPVLKIWEPLAPWRATIQGDLQNQPVGAEETLHLLGHDVGSGITSELAPGGDRLCNEG